MVRTFIMKFYKLYKNAVVPTITYFNLPFRNRAVYSTALSQFNIYANVQ